MGALGIQGAKGNSRFLGWGMGNHQGAGGEKYQKKVVRLFPYLDYCEYCCNAHGDMGTLIRKCDIYIYIFIFYININIYINISHVYINYIFI